MRMYEKKRKAAAQSAKGGGDGEQDPKSTMIKKNILKICNLFSLLSHLVTFFCVLLTSSSLLFGWYIAIASLALPPCSSLFYLTRFCYFLTFKAILNLVLCCFQFCVFSYSDSRVGHRRRRELFFFGWGMRRNKRRIQKYFVWLTKWCSWDMMETSRNVDEKMKKI